MPYVHTPVPPSVIEPHDALLVLRDRYGRRWRVCDVRAGERPIVRRRPCDPDATHREYRSHDGVRALLPLVPGPWHPEPARYPERCDARQAHAIARRFGVDWHDDPAALYHGLTRALWLTVGAAQAVRALGPARDAALYCDAYQVGGWEARPGEAWGGLGA